MAKVSWKGSALLSPLPVALVTVADGEREDVLTVAWTGIVNTQPPKLSVSVRPSRHSYGILQKGREFVVHPVTEALCRAADSCGVYTGAKIDKFQKFHLTKEKATEVSAPVIAEAPLALECRVTDVIPLGTHDLFLADILKVDVEESLLDASGKLCLQKANLVAYSHGDYFAMGKRLGSFGYSVKKKKTPGKKSPGTKG